MGDSTTLHITMGSEGETSQEESSSEQRQDTFRAIHIVMRKLNDYYNKQKECNAKLQMANDELLASQQKVSFVQQQINNQLQELSRTQKKIEDLNEFLEKLTSSDLSQAEDLVKKIIEGDNHNFETKMNDLFNSTSNKYSVFNSDYTQT